MNEVVIHLNNDLTHYAVETTLGLGSGFYGLVAAGWDLTDFGSPWRRGPLPAEALGVELLVGFLDSERASGVTWSAAESRESVLTYAAEHGVEPALAPTDAELDRVRDARRALFARWA